MKYERSFRRDLALATGSWCLRGHHRRFPQLSLPLLPVLTRAEAPMSSVVVRIRVETRTAR